MKRFFSCILLSSIVLHLFGKVGKVEPCERIYVQTDKHLYLAGEPVLMKLLTTSPEQIPLTFSKLAYVELVADSVAQLQIKVELTNGTGAGRMLLPADLPTGYYRLIAYTQFMRNEGADVFFEKNIAVLNTFQPDYNPVEEVMETEHHLSPDNPLTYRENGGRELSLQADKAIYTARERGELILSGLPENIHTLSVSIAGKEYVPVAESNVSLFRKNLTKKTGGNTITDLQHGEFLPEYEGHIVTGKIVDNQTGGKEVITEKILVSGLSFLSDGIRFFPGQNTETGDVLFFTSRISGINEIATVVYSADDKYRIDIQSPFVSRYVQKPMPALHIDSAYYDQLLERSVALQLFRYFADDLSVSRTISEPYHKMKPTASYPLDEYTRFTTMREVFTEFILGARFRRTDGKWRLSTFVKSGESYNYGSKMPLVLLDGVPISDHDAIYNYDPLLVERINIYYGPCILGGYMFDGIVELTTYRRLHADLDMSRSTQILTYEGPQLPYRFYTPDYSEDINRQNRIYDSRHTLLWNPELRTNGKTSIRLPFDTSDLTGEFQATIEGITNDGKFIFATLLFNVDR